MSHLKIYQSSAGSGKTYTLVKEYLLLVLKNPAYIRSTLAVTFTNDATGEMKERVVKALWELSKEKNEVLKNDIEKSLGDKFNIKQAAGIVLNHILHHYSELAIQTIDSFFLNITRSVAYETGLPGRYNIDLNRDAALDFMAAEVLLASGENMELTNWLIDFAFYRMENENGWNLQVSIRNAGKYLFSDEVQSRLQNLTVDAELIKQIRNWTNDYKDTLQQIAANILLILDSVGISDDNLFQKSKGFISAVRHINKDKLPKDLTFKSHFLKACDGGQVLSNELGNYALANDIRQELQKLRKYFEEGKTRFKTADAILKNIYLKGMLGYLNQQLTRYRKENQVLLISDVGGILRNFISNDDTPFIYEKAGNAYRNFLIDEFQDTSVTQWLNMLPLLINSLSQNNQVLTVGDVKQSIYRWRGGDMKLLMEEVKKSLSHHARKTDEKNLSSNYRSTEAVINFNNTLFSLASYIFADNQLIGRAFEKKQVEQKVVKNHMKGYVQVEIVSNENVEENFIYPDNVKDNVKCILSKTMLYIQQQISKGYTYGDIALLVRENAKGSLLADFLVLNGITQINSRDSLLINKAPQIRFLISAFRFIVNESDDIAEAHIRWYASKILNFDKKELDKMFFHSKKQYRQMALTEVGAALIHLFRLNTTPDAYIQRFEDLLLQKSSKGLYDVQLFLKWWDVENERMKISVQTPSDNNSITVMTIHGSKGLQFPVVILPFTSFEFASSKGEVWVETDVEPFNQFGVVPVMFDSGLEDSYFKSDFDKERDEKQLDELNAFYVACTRAEDKLFILLEGKGPEEVKKINHFVLAALGFAEMQSVIQQKSERLFAVGEDDSKPASKKKTNDLPDTYKTDSLKKYLINERGVHKGFKIRKHISEDDQRAFGIRLHDLMATFYSEEDKSKILNQIETLPLNDAKKMQLRKDADSAIDLIQQRQWIKEKYQVLNETEICDSEGNIIRPDRLMIKNKQAIVLDYKTGQPLNEHQQQMLGYKNVLEGAGFTTVETFLYYPESGEVVQVN